MSQPNQSQEEPGFDFSALLISAVFGVLVFLAHRFAPGAVESGMLVGVSVVVMAAKFLGPLCSRGVASHASVGWMPDRTSGDR